MITDLQERSDQINSGDQNKIIIKEINIEREDKNQQNIKVPQRLLNECVLYLGYTLSIHLDSFRIVYNQNKYEEAIVCLLKLYLLILNVIPHGITRNALLIHLESFRVVYNQNKYEEAIVCYDKAISINPQHDFAWFTKGYALILYYKNMLLHKLQQYTDAISCYKEALSIKITPVRSKLKGKLEAKQFYLAALEQGSNDKDYIQKQLSKL